MDKKLEDLERRIRVLEAWVDTQLRNKYYGTPTHGDLSKFTSGQLPEAKCIWETLPEEDRLKPMGISCPCRKCRGWC